MKQRALGSSDLQVSQVGLGCWQFGGDFGPIGAAKVHQIIDQALASGVNFFDTADVYGAGASESYLGEHLVDLKPAPVIATKYGRGPGSYPDGYSLTGLRDSVKRAQDRLRRHSIDLLQLHCVPTEVLRRGEIFDWLRTVQQEGHIRYFGASVETVEEGLLCVQQPGLTSLQVIYNLFRQKLREELLPVAADHRVGIIARLPLASGLLSGRYNEQTRFADTDHRHYNRDGQAFNVGETFAGIPFETGVKLVRQLDSLRPGGYTLAQMAVRWLLDQPAVTTVIPGASSPAQVRANAEIGRLDPLPDDLHRQLADFYKAKVAEHIRGAY